MKNYKYPVKIQSVRVQDGDILIFTIGDIEQGLIPSTADLDAYKKLLSPLFPNNKTVIAPPVIRTQVLRMGKGKKKK